MANNFDVLEVIDFIGNGIRRKRAEKMTQQPGFFDPNNLEQSLSAAGANPYAMSALTAGQGALGQRTGQQIQQRELDPAYRPTPMAVFDEGKRQFGEGLVRTDRGLDLQEAGQKQQGAQFDKSFGLQERGVTEGIRQFDANLGQRRHEFGKTFEQQGTQFAAEQQRLKDQTAGNQTLGWGQLYNDASDFQMGPEETYLQKVARGRLEGTGLAPIAGPTVPSSSGVDYSALVEQPSTGEMSDTFGARAARGATDAVAGGMLDLVGVQDPGSAPLPVPKPGQPMPQKPGLAPLGIPWQRPATDRNTVATIRPMDALLEARDASQQGADNLRYRVQSALGMNPQPPGAQVDYDVMGTLASPGLGRGARAEREQRVQNTDIEAIMELINMALQRRAQ